MSDRQGPVESADPRQALRTLIERGEGASASATMLRVMWLRQDHPAASVSTEAVHLNETTIVVRATISVPQGGNGSGLAAATVEDLSEWAEAVERTETNAISRALDTLGYLLERASAMTPVAQARSQPQPHLGPPQQQPQPQPQQPAHAPAQPQPQPQQGPRSMTPPSRPTAVPRTDDSAPPVVNALRRAQTRPQAVPPSPQAPAAAPRDEDAPLPEYSWTGFWNAARGFGLDAKRVEEILGRPANQSSPKEAVEALRAAGVWGSDEGNK